MASAGRILIMPKGPYNASTTYNMLDMVIHNGFSWLNKKTCVGITPSEENSEYWQNMFKINIANNLTTEEEGYALDARQGKYLKEQVALRHKTVTITETLTFENGFVEFAKDLSEYGDCLNVVATAVGVGNFFTTVISGPTKEDFRIRIFNVTEPTSTKEVVFRITYFFG